MLALCSLVRVGVWHADVSMGCGLDREAAGSQQRRRTMTSNVTGRESTLSRRAFLAATSGVLAGAAALGLDGRADAGEPKPGRGGTLRIGTRSDAIGLDPHRNLMYYVSFPIAYTTQGLL